MKFAVFVSGYGSNLQAIIEAVRNGQIKAELAVVFSDNRKAYALERAKEAGIKTFFLDFKQYVTRESSERELVMSLKNEKVDFIVLAGYMRLLTPFFVKTYKDRILNIHPSLLPSFKGTQGIKDAFTHGVKATGVTIHFVDEKMDHGPIILQEPVKILPRDTLKILEEKVHKIERRLYPKAIQLFVEGRLKIKGRKVVIT